MAIFVVAILYYAMGIGSALVYRQRMQDASDAAALSAAVMHARGMNFIVLINLIMAALVTILLALKLLQTLIAVGIVVATGLALVPGVGWATAAALVNSLQTLYTTVGNIHDQAKQVIFPALSALNQTSRAVRVVVPAAAQVGVIREVVGHYRPEAEIGFVLPSRMTLPVVDDRFDVLCGKAAENLVKLALGPVSEVPGVDLVSDAIEDAAGGLGEKLSSYFCSDGSGPAPSHATTVRRGYPSTPLTESCLDKTEQGSADQHKVCEEARAEAEAGAPGPDGDCPPGADCGVGGEYERRLALAREQCNPARHANITRFEWQEATLAETFQWDGARWRSLGYEARRSVVRNGSTPPCGPHLHAIGDEWRTELRAHRGQEQMQPLCGGPRPLAPGRRVGDEQTVEYRAVTQVLGCERKERRTISMEGRVASVDASEKNGRAPQRVEDGVEMGGEALQLRIVVLGQGASTKVVPILQLAAHGECGEAGEIDPDCQLPLASAARQLGRLSVAQSEYFFDGNVDRAEWMWQMRWRGRLRRFRMPEKGAERGSSDAEIARYGGMEPAQSAEQACQRSGAHPGCQNVSQGTSALGGLIAH